MGEPESQSKEASDFVRKQSPLNTGVAQPYQSTDTTDSSSSIRPSTIGIKPEIDDSSSITPSTKGTRPEIDECSKMIVPNKSQQ